MVYSAAAIAPIAPIAIAVLVLTITPVVSVAVEAMRPVRAIEAQLEVRQEETEAERGVPACARMLAVGMPAGDVIGVPGVRLRRTRDEERERGNGQAGDRKPRRAGGAGTNR